MSNRQLLHGPIRQRYATLADAQADRHQLAPDDPSYERSEYEAVTAISPDIAATTAALDAELPIHRRLLLG